MHASTLFQLPRLAEQLCDGAPLCQEMRRMPLSAQVIVDGSASTRSTSTEPVRLHVERARCREKPQSLIEQPRLSMGKQDAEWDNLQDDESMIMKLPKIKTRLSLTRWQQNSSSEDRDSIMSARVSASELSTQATPFSSTSETETLPVRAKPFTLSVKGFALCNEKASSDQVASNISDDQPVECQRASSLPKV
jgi:hypothetical protein